MSEFVAGNNWGPGSPSHQQYLADRLRHDDRCDLFDTETMPSARRCTCNPATPDAAGIERATACSLPDAESAPPRPPSRPHT